MNLIKNIFVLLQSVPVTIVQFYNPDVDPSEISLDNEINGNELSAYVNLYQLQNPTLTVFAEKTTYTQNGKEIPCIKFSASEVPPYTPADFETQFILQEQGQLARNFNETEEMAAVLGCTKSNDYTTAATSVPCIASFTLEAIRVDGQENPFNDYQFSLNGGGNYYLSYLGLNEAFRYQMLLIITGTTEGDKEFTCTETSFAEIEADECSTRMFSENLTNGKTYANNIAPGTAGYRIKVVAADEVRFYMNGADPVNEKSFVQYDSNDNVLGTSVAPVDSLDWTIDIIDTCVRIAIVDTAP